MIPNSSLYNMKTCLLNRHPKYLTYRRICLLNQKMTDEESQFSFDTETINKETTYEICERRKWCTYLPSDDGHLAPQQSNLATSTQQRLIQQRTIQRVVVVMVGVKLVSGGVSCWSYKKRRGSVEELVVQMEEQLQFQLHRITSRSNNNPKVCV